MEQLASLIEHAREGDLAAFGQLVGRFQDMAYGYAYSILGDFHLAEDAAQEAFIAAYQGLGQLRDPQAFPGWLRRIVHRRCRRLTRGRRVETVPLEAAAEVASPGGGPDESAEKRETAETVLAAIRALPEKQREATTLFYIDGYSQEEIAEFLEAPVHTVKNRLRASRSRLKTRLLSMAKDEFKKRALPEGFTEKVVTLAEILGAGPDRQYEFTFANGVTVRTRIEQVIQDSAGIHLLVCGPTKVTCHNVPGSYPDSFDSFLLVPSALVGVAAVGEGGEPTYQVAGAAEPTFGHPARFSPSPVATGPVDIGPGGFGIIRLGGEKRPFHYRDREGRKGSFPIAPDDIHVPEDVIKEHGIKPGDVVTCTWRRGVGNENFPGVVEVLSVERGEAGDQGS